ncbi:MAG: AAA family ATPase [Rhodocyclaceae bacterium]|nr:AAA family ATPase [Rhodocyclaceae bacterium]
MSKTNAMMKQIEAARRQGLLGELDVHFARLIAGYDESPPAVLAAALLSQLTSAGHVCLDLAAFAEQPVLGDLVSTPPLAEWIAALQAHPACGNVGAYTPLALEGSRLYMRRYFDYERAVAQAWQSGAPVELSAALQANVAALFPETQSGEDKLRDQRSAAVAALQNRRVLISGGPGTGKTTTLASILALLIEQSQADLPANPGLFDPRPSPMKILLSAPTGKAAARMQDAIREAKARLPLSAEVRAAMPETAQTLHRLLGARPQGGGMAWRHGADNPLSCDVLVVDEASMIDLALMARLLAALPTDARLILLGDRDQLASVDAGAVFADLCSAGAATLGVSFRFGADSGIGRLAALLRVGDADAAIRLLNAANPDLHWSPDAARPAVVAHALRRYAEFIEQARTVPGSGVFERFAAFRLLTPVRNGPLGVGALNAEIEKGLAALGAIPPRSRWYVGKPVMIAANDYALRLFNGDIGICVADPVSGELRIAFPAGDEGAPAATSSAPASGAPRGVRLLAPARLPAHETAWAMTVHKSQGSEFDEAALVLPDEQSEVVTRELVYTAVTRARRTATIWAAEPVLRAASQRRIARHSGLAERLRRR